MPGFAEVDLVSPSGNSASGEFADSLDLTDVFTGWTETRAILGKSRQAVRKLMGWDRYDTLEAVEAMNDLYRNELRWWLNLFQPSAMKKVRVGSRLCRRYDLPRTPLDRLGHGGSRQAAGCTRSAALVKLRQGLDPFELNRPIERKLRDLHPGAPASEPASSS